MEGGLLARRSNQQRVNIRWPGMSQVGERDRQLADQTADSADTNDRGIRRGIGKVVDDYHGGVCKRVGGVAQYETEDSEAQIRAAVFEMKCRRNDLAICSTCGEKAKTGRRRVPPHPRR